MININEEKKEFHLTNGLISYIFRVVEKSGVLEQLYFGAAIAQYPSYDFLIEREVRPSNNLYEGDYTSSLEHLKQELPVYGTTDFRYPAIEVVYPDGDHLSHFRYAGYQLANGKKNAPGMPGTFGAEAEVEQLTIYLRDDYSSLVVEMCYYLYKSLPVLTRQNHISHADQLTYQLENFMSLNLDLPNETFDWVHLDGAWARETQMARDKVVTGVQNVSSTRGASSHQHNPFMALCTPDADEDHGKVYGLSLIYSGNFLAQIELDTYNIARLQIGINPYQFSWTLGPDDKFTTPEAVLIFSAHGFNGMSQTFHDFYRQHLIRPNWVARNRPILINNWEATYFDFNEEKILTLAKNAQALGVEMLVLDDGWFGQRDNDASSLGDWFTDQRKLPAGISALGQKIQALGLKFGLWFEPEMISKGTKLYAEHPDWLVGHPEKNISHGRNQFVLDFSRPEVVANIFTQMDEILATTPIDYLKWDMNRYISEGYAAHLGKNRQGEFFHRYILGVYALYEKILAKYPELLIESCAGGGGRFDPGLLYYAPQTWVSDDTDAVERLNIQYGASLVYPLSTLGAHVSAVPNHQVARLTSLKTRGDVALFGTFGYELDVAKLSATEKEEIKAQVALVKKHQTLINQGDFYRLEKPSSGTCAWMVVSKDGRQALVARYQILAQPNEPYARLPLRGLAADKLYLVNGQKPARFGGDLMQIGLILAEDYTDRANDYWQRRLPGDFSSQLFYLVQV